MLVLLFHTVAQSIWSRSESRINVGLADPSPPVDALGHRRLHLPTLSRALCFLIMMFKDDHCFIIFALVHCPIHLPMLPRPLLPDPEDHFDRHFIKTYDHPYDADYLHT